MDKIFLFPNLMCLMMPVMIGKVRGNKDLLAEPGQKQQKNKIERKKRSR